MKQKLVITLTTVYGSHQYTLGQAAKYIFALFLVLSAISFFISNSLLVVTRSDLTDLSQNHQQLLSEYGEVVEVQQQFEQQNAELDQELGEVRNELGVLRSERDALARLNSTLDKQRSEMLAQKTALDNALNKLQRERDSLAEKNLSLAEQNQRIEQTTNQLAELEKMMGLSAGDRNASERIDQLQRVTEERRYLLNQIPSGVPLKNGARVTAGYGMRMHPVLKKRALHPGVDFRAKQGTPIYAPADGVVEYGGYHKKSGFGNLIILQHNFGFKTYYAHLKKVVVKGRQFISKGELIGYTGNTGISTGPHLHYEIRHMFNKLDPKPFLAMNISNVEETFRSIKAVKWESLKKHYPLNRSAPQ
ncbi:MAG: peptidoglycan DD-metalloendopeptidase family protein [Marinobacterium sp.]|nr:peptidoglycan DD-metalloendopeptidase family protein [Marinobacterium sp.]